MVKKKILDRFPRYKIYSDGRMWSMFSEIFLSFTISNGYHAVNLINNEKQQVRIRIHRLVAEAFVSGMTPALIVNHIDSNKLNNDYKNLEWITSSQNSRHHNDNFVIKRTVVTQILNGEKIAEFPNISEAFRRTGTSKGYITLSCRDGSLVPDEAGIRYSWSREKIPTKSLLPKDAKIIPGFENYLATTVGEIYSKNTQIYLRKCPNGDGYNMVTLIDKEGNKCTRTVHLLIAITYLTKLKGKNQINHIDRDKGNNSLENLEYVNAKENMDHVINTGSNSTRPIKMQIVFATTKEAAEYLKVTEKEIIEGPRKYKETKAGSFTRFVD